MENKERAEKMVQTMLVGLGHDKSHFEYFLSQLDESYAHGYAAAQEQAAGIVGEYSSINRETGQSNCYERIRAMSPNVPGRVR